MAQLEGAVPPLADEPLGAVAGAPAAAHARLVELVAASTPPGPADRSGRGPIDLAWVARLPSTTLRELASIAERYDRLEFRDPKAAAEELAEMLSNGNRPALGWYRRHVVPRQERRLWQPPSRDGMAFGD